MILWSETPRIHPKKIFFQGSDWIDRSIRENLRGCVGGKVSALGWWHTWGKKVRLLHSFLPHIGSATQMLRSYKVKFSKVPPWCESILIYKSKNIGSLSSGRFEKKNLHTLCFSLLTSPMKGPLLLMPINGPWKNEPILAFWSYPWERYTRKGEWKRGSHLILAQVGYFIFPEYVMLSPTSDSEDSQYKRVKNFPLMGSFPNLLSIWLL